MSTQLGQPAGKLTKKQQKALKHKSGARKGKSKQTEETQLDVPEADLLEEDESGVLEDIKSSKGKKRKREVEHEEQEIKDTSSSGTAAAKAKATKAEKATKRPKERKQRFIVFVGNLPYKVTTEDIINHFAEASGETPSVRLLTPKATPSDAEKASKTKGCAFVEFQTSAALQAALHLHQSLFTSSASSTKRKINVELTAGGGGRGETRMNKLHQTKERLEKQRENRKTIIDKEKEAKEEEKKKVREEWKQNVKKFGNGEGQPQQKRQRTTKKPAWLTGANAVRMG